MAVPPRCRVPLRDEFPTGQRDGRELRALALQVHGSGVQGFRIQQLRFRVYNLGFRDKGLRCRARDWEVFFCWNLVPRVLALQA
jgi:hypothetical protein